MRAGRRQAAKPRLPSGVGPGSWLQWAKMGAAPSQCACGGGVGAGECVGGVEGGGVEGGDGGGVQPGANTSYSPHVSGHITATSSVRASPAHSIVFPNSLPPCSNGVGNK